MHVRLRNTVLRLDWLTLLFPVCAMLLGEGSQLHLWLLSLSIHEAGHFLAAAALHVPIRTLRPTPFGCFAQMENPYIISTGKLCVISVAGPAANFLALLIVSSLCKWNLLSPVPTAGLCRINILLMLFNLLPALPLDGGRLFCAALSLILPRERAVRVCVFLGRILAVLLVFSSGMVFLLRRHLNLSFLFAAAFLFASSEDELRASRESRMHALLNAVKPLTHPVRAEIVAIDETTSPRTALRAAKADRLTIFAVYRNGIFDHLTDDRALLRSLINPGSSEDSLSRESMP